MTTPDRPPKRKRGKATEEMLRAVEDDAGWGKVVYPAGTTMTKADGREVSIEDLGYETHELPDR